jgi:CubicO group peptidase (beta-lactamase class C family)
MDLCSGKGFSATTGVRELGLRPSIGWLAAALLACAGCAPGVKDPSAQIDALLRSYQGAVPGASVLVVRDGVPVFRHAFGFANLEARTPATPATNYRLASMTKQFTAASILLLAEDRQLTLDDPVRKWLPSLPAAAHDITLKHLLTHTSGLIDYEDLMAEGTTQQLHDADVLHLLEAENRTYFAAGTQ